MPDKSGYFGDQANTTGCKRPANGSSNGDAPMRPDLPDHIPTDQLTDQPTDQPSDQPIGQVTADGACNRCGCRAASAAESRRCSPASGTGGGSYPRADRCPILLLSACARAVTVIDRLSVLTPRDVTSAFGVGHRFETRPTTCRKHAAMGLVRLLPSRPIRPAGYG